MYILLHFFAYYLIYLFQTTTGISPNHNWISKKKLYIKGFRRNYLEIFNCLEINLF